MDIFVIFKVIVSMCISFVDFALTALFPPRLLVVLQHILGKHADTGVIYRTAKEHKCAFRFQRKYQLILICEGCLYIWEGIAGKDFSRKGTL